MEALTTAITSGFTTMATDMMTAIGSVFPLVLPVLGAFAVIKISIKIFNKVTGN